MPAAGSRILAADTAKHYVFATQSTGQTIATGTANFTAVTFDAEAVDTDNIHDNVTNPSRFLLGAAALGYWEVSGAVAYTSVAATAAGDSIRCGVSLNGATGPTTGTQIIVASTTGVLQSVVLPPVVLSITSAADYVQFLTAHTNAASRATLVSGGYRSHFRAVWLGA